MIFFMPSKAEGFGESLYTCDNTYSDMQYLVSNPNVCKSSKCTPLKTHMTCFPIPSSHRRYTSSKFVDFPGRSWKIQASGAQAAQIAGQGLLGESGEKVRGENQLRLVKNPIVYQGFCTSQGGCFRISAINSITIDFKVASLPPKCSEWIPKMPLWKMYLALKCAYFEYLFVKFPWRSQIIGGKTCAEKIFPTMAVEFIAAKKKI